MTAFEGVVKWTLRNNKAEILQSGEKSVSVPALTAQNVLDIDLSDELKNRTDPREKYLEYSIMENGKELWHNALCAPERIYILRACHNLWHIRKRG